MWQLTFLIIKMYIESLTLARYFETCLRRAHRFSWKQLLTFFYFLGSEPSEAVVVNESKLESSAFSQGRDNLQIFCNKWINSSFKNLVYGFTMLKLMKQLQKSISEDLQTCLCSVCCNSLILHELKLYSVYLHLGWIFIIFKGLWKLGLHL